MKLESYELITKTMKLKPVEGGAEVSSNLHCAYECLICHKQSKVTGKYLIQKYKKYKSIGCADCAADTKRGVTRTNILEKFSPEYEFISDIYQIKNIEDEKVTVKRKECGHTFSTILAYITYDGVVCPECNRLNMKTQKFIRKDGSVVKKEKFSNDKILELFEERNKKNPTRQIFMWDVKDYQGMLYNQKFLCGKCNNTWIIRPVSILHAKSGCPYCAKTNYSQKAIKWLNSIAETEKIYIQHAENDGELYIKKLNGGRGFNADGYCEATNTVYEFHGSCYHGDPNVYEPTDHPHPYNKLLTAKELLDATINREMIVKSLGYNLVTIWESEFDSLLDS